MLAVVKMHTEGKWLEEEDQAPEAAECLYDLTSP